MQIDTHFQLRKNWLKTSSRSKILKLRMVCAFAQRKPARGEDRLKFSHEYAAYITVVKTKHDASVKMTQNSNVKRESHLSSLYIFFRCRTRYIKMSIVSLPICCEHSNKDNFNGMIACTFQIATAKQKLITASAPGPTSLSLPCSQKSDRGLQSPCSRLHILDECRRCEPHDNHYQCTAEPKYPEQYHEVEKRQGVHLGKMRGKNTKRKDIIAQNAEAILTNQRCLRNGSLLRRLNFA